MKHIQNLVLLALALFSQVGPVGAATMVTDALGRDVEVPEVVSRVICSGPGCLRLLTYLQAQDLVVGVDDMETRRSSLFEARPYALAQPQFSTMPLFGEFRGHDNPEQILTLDPQPQVIFKTYGASMGYHPAELQQKTAIPVVALGYGDLTEQRPVFYESLRLMATIINRQARAEAVIAFFEESIADLQGRTSQDDEQRPGVFLGGVAFKGPHGFQSTEPQYPSFVFVGANNLAQVQGQSTSELRHTVVSKEKIVDWDPQILFVDLATLQLGEKASGLYELRTDPVYRSLAAVRNGRVYGLLPYNWYAQNYGSILANAYFTGKLLYPQRFTDIEPGQKADGIYSFLVGKPVFGKMNASFANLAYTAIAMD